VGIQHVCESLSKMLCSGMKVFNIILFIYFSLFLWTRDLNLDLPPILWQFPVIHVLWIYFWWIWLHSDTLLRFLFRINIWLIYYRQIENHLNRRCHRLFSFFCDSYIIILVMYEFLIFSFLILNMNSFGWSKFNNVVIELFED
jgi:hypothetical protein